MFEHRIKKWIRGTSGLLVFVIFTSTSGYADTAVYYHMDEKGSTRVISDVQASIKQAYSYDMYGEPSSANPIAADTNPYRLNGAFGVRDEVLDDHTIYHMKHRYYSSKLKRFLSKDPAGIDGGHNLYAFADANPVHFMDPFGLCAEGYGAYGALSEMGGQNRNSFFDMAGDGSLRGFQGNRAWTAHKLNVGDHYEPFKEWKELARYPREREAALDGIDEALSLAGMIPGGELFDLARGVLNLARKKPWTTTALCFAGAALGITGFVAVRHIRAVRQAKMMANSENMSDLATYITKPKIKNALNGEGISDIYIPYMGKHMDDFTEYRLPPAFYLMDDEWNTMAESSPFIKAFLDDEYDNYFNLITPESRKQETIANWDLLRSMEKGTPQSHAFKQNLLKKADSLNLNMSHRIIMTDNSSMLQGLDARAKPFHFNQSENVNMPMIFLSDKFARNGDYNQALALVLRERLYDRAVDRYNPYNRTRLFHEAVVARYMRQKGLEVPERIRTSAELYDITKGF